MGFLVLIWSEAFHLPTWGSHAYGTTKIVTHVGSQFLLLSVFECSCCLFVGVGRDVAPGPEFIKYLRDGITWDYKHCIIYLIGTFSHLPRLQLLSALTFLGSILWVMVPCLIYGFHFLSFIHGCLFYGFPPIILSLHPCHLGHHWFLCWFLSLVLFFS